MGWRKKWRNLRERYLSGEAPSCGYTSFSSSPDCTTNSAWAFGLTQTQSTPGGTSTVPLVSIAISNLRSCKSSMSASIQLEKGFATGTHDKAAVRQIAVATLPQ